MNFQIILQSLNGWIESFCAFHGRMLLQSGLLILGVLILNHVLRFKMRAVVRYAFLLLVLLKLVLPPSLPSIFTSWVGNSKPAGVVMEETPIIPHVSGTLMERHRDGEKNVSGVEVNWQMLIAGIWLFGVLGGITILIRQTNLLQRLHKNSFVCGGKTRGLFQECLDHLEMRGKVGLRISDEYSEPVVTGLWNPCVYVPRRLEECFSAEEIRIMLVHELLHVKRGDLWVNAIQRMLQIFYWWNPLLWIANKEIQRVREEAVDETVMDLFREDADLYPAMLLKCAQYAGERQLVGFGLLGIGKSGLSQRISLILERSIKTARLGWKTMCGVLLAGALVIPMGSSGAAVEGNEKGVEIKFQFFAASDLDQPLEIETEGSVFRSGSALVQRPDSMIAKQFLDQGFERVGNPFHARFPEAEILSRKNQPYRKKLESGMLEFRPVIKNETLNLKFHMESDLKKKPYEVSFKEGDAAMVILGDGRYLVINWSRK